MAFTAKLTIRREKPYKGDVVIAAGASEAQTDTISVNIDATNLSKGEAIIMLENMIAAIHAGNWPIN